jgi:threonine/homoserine efflux transporter RhtA
MLGVLGSAAPALAAAEEALATQQIVLTSSMIGVVCVAAASAVGMMRQRARAEATIIRLSADNAHLKAQADRAEALLDGEDQLILAWSQIGEPPLLLGSAGPAFAAAEEALATQQIVLTSSMIGVVCVAAASAVGMMRQRARAEEIGRAHV